MVITFFPIHRLPRSSDLAPPEAFEVNFEDTIDAIGPDLLEKSSQTLD